LAVGLNVASPAFDSARLRIDFQDVFSGPGAHSAVLIGSSFDGIVGDELYGIVDGGGGLAVFYNDPPGSEHRINSLLVRFDLAFAFCTMNGRGESSEIHIQQTYSAVSSVHLYPLCDQLRTVFGGWGSETDDVHGLDALATLIRYHIGVCGSEQAAVLGELLDRCWGFLSATHYASPGAICPGLHQGIVVVLLLHLYTRLPPRLVRAVPEHEWFPGKAENAEPVDVNLDVELAEHAWTSTGLWLPAGVIGTVGCAEENCAGVHIQIGAHTGDLLGKPGPWKRWPVAVSVIPLTKGSTQVVSPLGGIVYVVVESVTRRSPRRLALQFSGFYRHPMADAAHPATWEDTKESPVPWGEFNGGGVIFTLPVSELVRIPDFGAAAEKFDQITTGVSEFLSATWDRPYRLVFDVDLADGAPSCGYPFVFSVDDIDDILVNLDEPSASLFTVVTFMAVFAFRANCFASIPETAIATLVAAVVLKKIWPEFDPLTFAGIRFPGLFQALWEIQTNENEQIIPRTLAHFQNPTTAIADIPEANWAKFVNLLGAVTRKSYNYLMDIK
jgi:hypothetical protein